MFLKIPIRQQSPGRFDEHRSKRLNLPRSDRQTDQREPRRHALAGPFFPLYVTFGATLDLLSGGALLILRSRGMDLAEVGLLQRINLPVRLTYLEASALVFLACRRPRTRREPHCCKLSRRVGPICTLIPAWEGPCLFRQLAGASRPSVGGGQASLQNGHTRGLPTIDLL